jgi:hypothetical protein
MSRELEHTLICCCYFSKIFLKVLTLVKTTINQKAFKNKLHHNIVIKYLFFNEREFSLLKSNNKK